MQLLKNKNLSKNNLQENIYQNYHKIQTFNKKNNNNNKFNKINLMKLNYFKINIMIIINPIF